MGQVGDHVSQFPKLLLWISFRVSSMVSLEYSTWWTLEVVFWTLEVVFKDDGALLVQVLVAMDHVPAHIFIIVCFGQIDVTCVVMVSSKKRQQIYSKFRPFFRPNFQKTICFVLFGVFPERLFVTGERPAMLERPGSNSSMNTSAPSTVLTFSYRGKWAEIDRMFLQLRNQFEGQPQQEEAEKRPVDFWSGFFSR